MGDEEPRSIEDREARVREIDTRLAEIDREHDGTLMPEATRSEWHALNSERDEHVETIKELRVRQETLLTIAAGQGGGIEAGGRAAGVPEFLRRRSDDEIYDVAGIRFGARSEEEYRDRLHDHAKRAIDKATFPGSPVGRERAQARAMELLQGHDDAKGTLAARMLLTGSPVYQRAFGKAVSRLSVTGLSTEEQRALSLSSDPAGGYAVPFDLDPSVILTNDGSSNPLRQMSRVEMIVGKEWQGVTSAGITVTRVPEVQEATDGNPVMAQPNVRPSAVHAFVPFSMDLDVDWPQLRTQVTRIIQDAKDNEEADSFVTGDGSAISSGGDRPEGIMEGLPAGSEVAGGASFTSEQLYMLEDDLGDRWLARAQFLANRSIYNLVRQFDTQGGADLWVRLGEGPAGELIGYPARRASAMPRTPTGKYLILGDFSQFLIVDRIGMSVELVPHLFGGSNRYPNGQRGIYARWRNSTKILVPNAFRALTDDES